MKHMDMSIVYRSNNSQSAGDGGESDSLFMGDVHSNDVIQRMIEHAQNVAFWVAAEIVSCSSQKVQFKCKN